jgi:hypothetical protein
VTFDELEQLLLRPTGNSIEALEQQIQTRLKKQTLVGGKRHAARTVMLAGEEGDPAGRAGRP